MSLWRTYCCYLFIILYVLYFTTAATVSQDAFVSSKGSKPFIQNDESLFALGTYARGELGIELTTNTPYVPYPLDFSGFNFTVKEIIIGSGLNCFLSNSGELYSLGNNDFGQLGDGTAGTFASTVPSRFNIGKPIVKAATGTCHTLVLTADGEVYGSGCNQHNVLSAETSSSFPSPILIFNSSYNIIDIETNLYLTIALSSTGEIYTLGRNNGHPETGNNLLAKVTQGLTGKFIKRVVSGPEYTIVETSANEFYIFGSMIYNFEIPTLIEGLSGVNWKNCTDIKTSKNSFLCLVNGGTLYEISSVNGNEFSVNVKEEQLQNKIKLIAFDKLLTKDNVLMKIIGRKVFSLNNVKPNTEIVKIVADSKHSNFLAYYYANDGSFYYSLNGLGNANGNTGNNFGFSPLNITSFYMNFNPFNLNYIKPSKGLGLSVFVNSIDNTIFTTGLNSLGALGDGSSVDALSPMNITINMDLLKDKEIVDISVGHYHTLILTKDREVYAFGNNYKKQFCQTTITELNQLMKLPLSNVVAISAGLDFSLFVIASPEGNRVYACGYSGNGETGIGVTQNIANSYIDFFNNTNITSVVGGDAFSFFLADNGTAYALGSNLKNRFGINDWDGSIFPSPIAVGTGISDKIIKISSVREISLFLTDKGEVFYTRHDSPKTTKLDGLVGENVIDIGTGSNYGLILTNDGKIYGIFSGFYTEYYGQLGMLNPGLNELHRIPLYYKVKRMEVGLYHSFLAVSNVETFCGVSNCFYNGICAGDNVCKCNDGYKGSPYCNVTSCENVDNCSKHGLCIGPNTCECNSGWKGNLNCSQISCESVSQCSSKGICVGPNQCECSSGWRSNSNCSQHSCESVDGCSNNGLCIGPNTCSCFKNWTGNNCSIPLCFNIPANETSKVCNNGNGTCTGVNTCECFSGYTSPDCSQFSCKEVNYCSGHGSCIGPNQCFCNEGWGGNNCSIYNCLNLNSCSSNGICTGPNICNCSLGWEGYNCSTFNCDNRNNCSNHGICSGPNQCECFSGWKGNANCSQPSCELLNSCYGHGSCVAPNQCECNGGWNIYSNCSQYSCDNNCNHQGTCVGPNQCLCDNGWKGNLNCSQYSCESVGSCSSNGMCIGPNTCSCFEGWTGSNCSIPLCFNIPANETNTVCNYGNGTCISPDKCKCNSNWGGATCKIPKCYDIPANETSKVCNNGNGTCTGVNTCECFSGYTSPDCSQFSCKEVNYCSGHGSCIGPNQCLCNEGWKGYNCSSFNCDNRNNCSNHGVCSGPDTCSCIIGWKGNLNCSQPSCELMNGCYKHGSCIAPNQCDCQPEWTVYKNCSEKTVTNYNCDSLNNCYGNGQCIGANQCKCFEGYQSFDCKYKSLSSDSIVISGKSEGTEKISTFSFAINVENNTVDTSQIIYNYFIENVINQTTNSSTIEFTMKSKGSYNLIVTLFVKERQDFIYGKQFKTITVNELKEDTITNLNINDIYEITKNNDIYNNENKSTIINQIVTTTQKETIQTKDQGDKILDIYKSIIVKSNNDIPISVNITSQMNQISNLYLTMKKNDKITDNQIDSSVQSIVLILDNILQQTNSSSNITNISKDDLKRDTENTLQTTFSLLSLSKSIEEKRIEGNAINLVFKRRTTTTNGNTNLNITTEYQFNIPTDLNLETSNNDISFGAIKIGDSQIYQTNNEMTSLSNVIQLKTFVNGSYTPLKNLKQSIIISFKLESKDINSFNLTTSYSCRYFNDNSKQWLSDGCKPVGAVTLNNGIIVMNCECDHTTSFLTFLESNSKSNNTSIAQLVLSSIYLLIIILIFILLIIFRKDPIVKSRYITPFIGLTAIFIDCLFSGIIANAIFQQTKIFNTLSSITITTSNASDIVGNVAIIISSMMTLIAIACYFIESFRYLIIRYLYEILNNNLKDNNDTNQLLNSNVEKKPVLKILSSKLIYVISALVISISIIIYYVIFVIIRRFNVISSTAFTSVTSIAFFVLIILFSLSIASIYIIDIYFTMKYKQFSNEMIDLIKIMESDEQNSSTSSLSTNNTTSKKNKKEMINNYQNNLINFFYYNDSLLFRSEACIYFIGLIFFIISFGIGFYLLSKEQLKEQQQLSEVILAFDLIRTISWIMLFGGYITMIILIKKLKNLVFKNKKLNNNLDSGNDNSSGSEENEEFNFSFILKKREVFKLFKQFAKQEFSLENIYAFIDLENLKELNKQSHENKQDTNNNNNIWEEAEKFKSKYLITNATMELNVSFELKKQVNNYLNERKEMNNLIECIENALSINLGDTYSRFIETDEYQIIDKCNEMKEKLIHN